MAKSLFKFKSKRRDYEEIGRKLGRRHVNIATTNYLPALQRIVEPFDTDIPFTSITSNSGGDLRVLLQPLVGPTVERANGDAVLTAQIFFWLNDGTNERFAHMPGDFQNESFPNSLSTRSSSYDRSKIYLGDSLPGLEPRNFLKLVKREMAPTYRRRMKLALDAAIV